MGQPERKVREIEGQMPFEEWIYGAPPKPVQFVRINGNRVIRVEIARVGEAPVVFDKDEVEGLMRTDGSPLVASDAATHTVKMGDVQRDPDKEAAAPPPSLTAPGEKLPDNAQIQPGGMKPVEFPKQKPDDYPDVEAALRADQARAAETADKAKDAQQDTQPDPSKPKPSDTGTGTQKPASGQGSGSSSTEAPATAPAPPPADATQPH